jgi:hypothetical protein
MPHISDSVELTKLSFGLLGSHIVLILLRAQLLGLTYIESCNLCGHCCRCYCNKHNEYPFYFIHFFPRNTYNTGYLNGINHGSSLMCSIFYKDGEIIKLKGIGNYNLPLQLFLPSIVRLTLLVFGSHTMNPRSS